MSELLTSKDVAEFEAWWEAKCRAEFVAAYGPNENFRPNWGGGFEKEARAAWMAARSSVETGDERARMAERLLRSAHRELSLSPDDKALAARIGEWLEGSVPETTAPHPDTVRLEWLLQHVSGKEWRRLGVLYGDGANRTLLNDAMAASQVKSTGEST